MTGMERRHPDRSPAWEPHLLSTVLDRAEQIIIALDSEGRVCLFNHHCTAITGHTRESVLGKRPSPILFSRQEENRLLHHLSCIDRQSNSGLLASQWQLASGVSRRVSLLWTEVRDDRGILICHLGMTSEGAHLTRAIIESAIDGIITIDHSGVVQSFNAAAERIFGYSREEAIGRNVAFLMPSPDREQHDAYLKRFLETRQPRIIGSGRNVMGLRKNGTQVPVRLAVGEYEVQGKTMFVGFTQDLSALEQARTEATYYLEKLAHLNRINAMGEMASSMAHQIRQPLMAIQSFATVARNALTARDTAAEDNPGGCAERALEEIIRQSTHANDIIKEMCLFLKRDQQPRKEAADMISITRNVLTLLSHELCSVGISVELETDNPPCVCHVNRVQVEQVLYNLISNAIDALREVAGPKQLRLVCQRSDEEQRCMISIQDNGLGLPHEDVEQLCEPGFTTKSDGLGHGLAICRSILEHHGGELQAENADGGGAIFRFNLPLVSEAP